MDGHHATRWPAWPGAEGAGPDTPPRRRAARKIISARPAANIEYVDLVVGSGGTGVLAMNIKNMGNVKIDTTAVDVQLDVNNDDNDDCTGENIGGNGNPGGTISATCTLSGVAAGNAYSGFVVAGFTDGSSQSYAFTVRARAA